MNNVYVYEDTFANLLDLIFYLLIEKIKPDNIKDENNYQPDLLSNKIKPVIKIKNKKELLTKIGWENLKLCHYAFRTNDPNKELIIYYYLLNSLKYENNTKYMRNLKCVNKTLKLAHYVSRENHKFKGFLRFKETENNFLYAEIEPENNILDLLANHFKKRLSNENWLIKDQKRKQYCFYNQKKLYFLNEKDVIKLNLELSKNEKNVENLWCCFFKTIAIKERENKKCQMNFMPKKYWKNIIEMEEEYEKDN